MQSWLPHCECHKAIDAKLSPEYDLIVELALGNEGPKPQTPAAVANPKANSVRDVDVPSWWPASCPAQLLPVWGLAWSQASECLVPRPGQTLSLRTRSVKATGDKVQKSGEGRGGAAPPGASTSKVTASASGQLQVSPGRARTVGAQATQRRRSGSGAWQLAPLAPEHHWHQHFDTRGSEQHRRSTQDKPPTVPTGASIQNAGPQSARHMQGIRILAPKGTRPQRGSGVLVKSTALPFKAAGQASMVGN